jgi:hypothetical protein
MGKLRTYVVSFTPAQRTAGGGGITMILSMMGDGPRHEIEAGDFPTLEAAVRKLAAEYGQTCSPYVRLKDRNERSPAGFERWKDTLRIIDVAPKPVVPIAAPEAEAAAESLTDDELWARIDAAKATLATLRLRTDNTSTEQGTIRDTLRHYLAQLRYPFCNTAKCPHWRGYCGRDPACND